jgi:hypothetical protein
MVCIGNIVGLKSNLLLWKEGKSRNGTYSTRIQRVICRSSIALNCFKKQNQEKHFCWAEAQPTEKEKKVYCWENSPIKGFPSFFSTPQVS